MAKLEAKAVSTALDKRMAANYKDLKLKPIHVSSGFDDCISTLHSARLLPGVVCPLHKLWEKAQTELREAGLLPLVNYDINTLGLSAHVSTKGWAELHQPGSPHLSIKLFLSSNLSLTDRTVHSLDKEKPDSTTYLDEKLAEPASMKDLRKALMAAHMAQRLVTPWNFSIAALHGFMEASDFCAQYFTSSTDQPKLLRQFIDSVFTQNASHYRAGLPFLTSRDIGTL
jgi:hypothetical protein